AGASPDGECPLVVDDSTPSCGDSRFGCWVCTMVEKDKSMTAMIQNDVEKEWMMPLLELRNALDSRGCGETGPEDGSDHHLRDFRRLTGAVQLMATGKPVPGPYTQEARAFWLRKLLQAQAHIRKNGPPEVRDIELISIDELQEILNRNSGLKGLCGTNDLREVLAWAQAGKDIPCLGTTHADYFHGPVPVTRRLMEKETETDYEYNTGLVIAEAIGERDPLTMPAVLVNSHGPFTWGRSVAAALQNAVILEEVAKIAFLSLSIAPANEIEKHLLDRHYARKHGASARYGQNKV
nr:class II aldolase/adducin family protein [Bacteroidales bacterium]